MFLHDPLKTDETVVQRPVDDPRTKESTAVRQIILELRPECVALRVSLDELGQDRVCRLLRVDPC